MICETFRAALMIDDDIFVSLIFFWESGMHPAVLCTATTCMDTYHNTEMKVSQSLTGVEDVYVYDDTFS